MNRKTLEKRQEAKRLLLDGRLGIKAGDLLLFFVKPSRSSLNKRVKVYQIKTDTDGRQILLCLTRNIAVLMGLANSEQAEHKAFNDGMLTDDGIGELSHYLAVRLFDEQTAKAKPFIDESIYM